MDALVSTEWLFSNRDAKGLQLVDASIFPPNIARNPKEEYANAHIEGAAFFDIDAIADKNTPLPHMLPKADEFAAAMKKLGISSDTHVVAYDSMGIFGAARAWWMLRAMGHTNVSVLDGGLVKWLAEGRPTSTALPQLNITANYTATPRPALVKCKDSLSAQLLDARSSGRFAGSEPEPWPGRRSGHIPGAINIPFGELLAADKTMLPPAALRARFAAAGVDFTQATTCMCGSGVSACVLALALFMAGQEEAAVYDGSWAEWGLPGGGALESA